LNESFVPVLPVLDDKPHVRELDDMKMISSGTTRYSSTGTRRSKRRISWSRTSSNSRLELETQLDDSDASGNRLSRFTQSHRLLSCQLNLDKARAIILVATAAADDVHFFA